MTAPPIRVSGVAYDRPVGKRLELGPDGDLTKMLLLNERARAGQMINRSFGSAKEAFEFRLSATARQMFLAGTFAPELTEATVVTKGALDRAHFEFDPFSMPPLVALTKEHLAFRAEASLIPIDVDFKDPAQVAGMWPARGCPKLVSPRDVLDALYEVLPEAKGHPVMVTPSSSSMIEDASTGQLLRGPGGWRILLVTSDASQTPRILQTIHLRCWAKGIHCFAFVSRGGQVLHRSLADQALAWPTQPDYPTADLGPGLRKAVTCTLIENVDANYFDPSSVQTTHEDDLLARENLAGARSSLQTQAEVVVSARERAVAEAMVARGVPVATARRAGRARSKGVLLGADTVVFDDDQVVAVWALLSNGAEYDGRLCRDPVEPEYDGGRAVAKLFWNDGLGPRVHSFAHGSRTYQLLYDFESAQQAILTAEPTSSSIAPILAQSEADDIQLAQLEAEAARKLNLGNRRQILRDAVKRLRREIGQPPIDDRTGADFLLEPREGPREPLTSEFPVTGLKGQPLDHMDNVQHILDGYGISYHYNEITKSFEWEHGEFRQEGDNAGEMLHSLLLSLCSLNGVPKQNIGTHLIALGNLKTYNPVTEHLSSLVWDGIPRLEKLANAMGGDDQEIVKAAVRILFLQACAAADNAVNARQANERYQPSFECVIVFAGAQGIGKTKGIRKLLPRPLRRYFKEGVVLDLRNKDSTKQAISAWIVELGELDSTFRKSDIAVLKAFLSQQVDEIRVPYAHKSSQFARRTSFVASVNDLQFLVDETGNRRFVPIAVEAIDVGWSEGEMEQVWAEAYSRYCTGEKWWPTSEEEILLAANAEKYRFRSIVEEKIETTYDWSQHPESTTRRFTASEVLEKVAPGLVHDALKAKTVGTALRRLWMASPFVERRGATLLLKGTDIRLLTEGGANRGWLLPPQKQKGLSVINFMSPNPPQSPPPARRMTAASSSNGRARPRTRSRPP